MRPRWTFAACIALTVLLALSVPPWPDDWDGLGFVQSIHRFDLERFAPHPPGYPVYVALLRLASWFIPGAICAANATAVFSSAIGFAALASAARRQFSAHASLPVLLATAATPLVWRCSSAIGSEAPAFACASLTLYGLSRRDALGAWVAGVFLGLGLGVRVSWAPLLVPMALLAPRGQRLRMVVTALVAVLAWAIPFVWIVGLRHLVRLMKTHLIGHASRWGGTAITDPVRVRYLARDLFVDGVGAGDDVLGVAISAVGALASVLALTAWRRHSWRGWKAAAIVCAPYLVWIAIGQNLRQQPRHALPLVVALASALGLAAAYDRRSRVPLGMLFALVAARSAMDAHDRRIVPPTGVQLVGLVRGLPDRPRVMVFGGPSARFFEDTELKSQAVTVGSLGDVFLALGREGRLPARVFVTSEVERVEEPGYRFDLLAVLSRPPRLDRRAPTLEVLEMHAPFLPHE
jgi:hypothetical protein